MGIFIIKTNMISFLTLVLLVVAIGIQIRINRNLHNHIRLLENERPIIIEGKQGEKESVGPMGKVGPMNPMTEIEINMRKENDSIIVQKMFMVHPELQNDTDLMRILVRQ
jgi:hypothetical protein